MGCFFISNFGLKNTSRQEEYTCWGYKVAKATDIVAKIEQKHMYVN